MHDYSKYQLKSDEELTELLCDKDDFVVLTCNKCFKIINEQAMPESEPAYFLDLASKLGKNVIKLQKVDFLCNSHRLPYFLESLNADLQNISQTKPAIVCIACGIGTQTVAGAVFNLPHDNSLYAQPVYTLCDSIQTGGGHGMALSDKKCSACGQCVLTKTGGICPVSGCAKSLLNGPCGGAKNGKCETDASKDCVWDKIYSRVLLNTSDNIPHPETLAYNTILPGILNWNSMTVRRRRSESFPGGLYLKYRKDRTSSMPLSRFSLHSFVTIPMSQHAGNSAEPIVRVGDYVYLGQKIGEAVGTLSSSVHSSVSGHITEIVCHSHPNTYSDTVSITIKSDGKDALHSSVIPIPYWEDLDVLDIQAIIAEKGIVGMGGAGFPTPVKLHSPKPIDTIIINGCESEPYITADHQMLLQRSGDICTGLQIMLKSTGAKRGIIVISDNKSDAISHMESRTSDFDDIFVMALWSKYPQGAERMLISRVLGRKLAYGQRPYDVGAIVINVSTAAAVGDAFIRGMPLIERAVTVSGEKIKNPGNFMVRIGTPVSQLLDFCGFDDADAAVILGGPMMGATTNDYNVPVIKGTNAIIAVNAPVNGSADCIRCGRCVEVCPMELLPLYFNNSVPGRMTGHLYVNHSSPGNIHATGICSEANKPGCGSIRTSDAKLPDEINPNNCIECGACDYICPSRIEIRKSIRELKKSLHAV